MNILRTTALILSVSLYTATATAAPPQEPYHVMWTNAKGKEKCCNKKGKDKADACAAKLRNKQDKASNVQVMAGKCKSM